MSALRAWGGALLSLVVAAAGTGMLVIGIQSKSQAHSSLEGARRLHTARLKVAEAQRALGSSNIEDAMASGRKANAVARRVGAETERIADLLTPLAKSAKRATGLGRRGISAVVVARRRTAIAARVLSVLAGYQHSAVGSSRKTNGALLRVLRALKRTNESIP